MKVEATFVVSAATARDLPRDGLRELAFIGRSNVGKSSLINALLRRRLARTSGAPGKTRLANVYRVTRGSSPPFYLVDLPGFGFARGKREELDAVTREYFGSAGGHASGREGAARSGREASASGGGAPRESEERRAPAQVRNVAGLLLVDSRHPGLASDVEAWRWLNQAVDHAAIVATKIDKLSRSERPRAMKTNEAVFEHPVLPVSAETGEGLDALWKLIDQLTKSA